MKKIISLFLAAVLAVSCLSLSGLAAQVQESQVIYLEDGGYIVVSCSQQQTRSPDGTVSGRKDWTYYNGQGVQEWKYTLYATFEYIRGTEAVCTQTSCSVSIQDDAWSCTSKSATPGFACAVGNATMVRKLLFLTTSTVPVSVTLNCDTFGNLS